MISLPARLSLTCCSCRRGFSVDSVELSDLAEISCPFCRTSNSVLDLLPTDLRLLVYREIREQIESSALARLNETDPAES